MATPLNKLHEVFARLLKEQTGFTAAIGGVADDILWAQAAPFILNGNTILTVPGPLSNQITLKQSGLIMNVPLAGLVEVRVTSDTAVTSTLSIPVGARTDGPNYFFSQFTTWNEAPVLLSNRYSHVYAVYDVTKPNNMAIGIIANSSISDPNPGLLTNLGVSVSARQAVCFVDSLGRVTLLKTFPAIFNQTAAVPSDAPASFADWFKSPSLNNTNVVQVQFTFPDGVGTGSVGQIAVTLSGEIVAFLTISPQLLKDADIPITLKWNIMIGEPGAFLA